MTATRTIELIYIALCSFFYSKLQERANEFNFLVHERIHFSLLEKDTS